jgi:hypothetical protein
VPVPRAGSTTEKSHRRPHEAVHAPARCSGIANSGPSRPRTVLVEDPGFCGPGGREHDVAVSSLRALRECAVDLVNSLDQRRVGGWAERRRASFDAGTHQVRRGSVGAAGEQEQQGPDRPADLGSLPGSAVDVRGGQMHAGWSAPGPAGPAHRPHPLGAFERGVERHAGGEAERHGDVLDAHLRSNSRLSRVLQRFSRRLRCGGGCGQPAGNAGSRPLRGHGTRLNGALS